VSFGESVNVSVLTKDCFDRPVEGATVTATIGDLEVLVAFMDEGNGIYRTTIDTTIVELGSHEITITAERAGHIQGQTFKILTVKAIPLQASLQLSAETLSPGENIEILVTVRDEDGNLVPGAEVTVALSNAVGIMELSDQGNGNYQENLSTTSFDEGTYKMTVTARKTGYEPAQASGSFVVKVAVPWLLLYGGIAAVAVAAIAILHLIRRRT